MHAHVASWWWGCRRRRALRAARDARCKARFALLPRARVGWHAARISLPPLPPRSRGGAREGGPAQWLTARGRRASGVAAAPRSRAAGAPAARRRRALGGARACRAFERLGGPWSGPPFRGRRRRLFSRARLPSSELGKYINYAPTVYIIVKYKVILKTIYIVKVILKTIYSCTQREHGHHAPLPLPTRCR